MNNKERQKEYYFKNIEHRKKKMREWYQRNKQRLQKKQRQYYYDYKERDGEKRKKQQKKWKNKNKEKLKSYNKKYQIEHREYYAEYQRNRLSKEKTEYAKRWRRNNIETYRIMHNAHAHVCRHLKKGTIVKQPCKICGSTKRIHAHHDDYSKPLEVNWLCPLHHSERHLDLSTVDN